MFRLSQVKPHHLVPLGFVAAVLPLLLFQLNASTSTTIPPVRLSTTQATPRLSIRPANLVDNDFAGHVEQLRKNLPGNEFTIVVEPPFVVIGDEPAATVKEHSETTVRWAVEKLKQDYFAKDPEEILDIWLFKDSASYERNAFALFGEKPSTPYGYYSPTHKSLIMNISTGGGTLVHEIVHPFIEANFPACPPWLNEGLGSLYEQCGEVDGHIHGYTNWRLPGLQKAIKAGSIPSFKTLMSMDRNTFYGDAKGTNYAQSRYLCFYLQQRGLLRRFYHRFLSRQKSDPTGYATLRRILAAGNMNAFQRRWEKYVMSLSQDVVLTPVSP